MSGFSLRSSFERGRRTATVALVVILLGVAIGAAARAARRFESEIGGYVDELRSNAAGPEGTVGEADLANLPAPIERYVEAVLADGQPHVRAVRLRQRGEFRLGGPNAPWRPLEATQQFTVRPPGFVWDARIGLSPLLPVRVVDLYADGKGRLRAKLRSAITVADVGPNSALNEGELTRYLAECVWFPTALLPAAGVEWEPIDDRSARATLEHRGVTASAVFHVDDRDLVTRVTADRYRQEDDAYARWTGRFRDYAERNGMRIPLAAEVAWNLPEGDLPYWRARIVDIDHVTVGNR